MALSLALTGALAAPTVLGARALAQEVPEEVPEGPRPTSVEAVQPVDAVAPEATEDRLARMEERDRARDEELARALARIAALEATPATAAPSGPTLRPLAYLLTRFEHREGYDALASSRALATAGCFGGTGTTPQLSDSDCVRYRARAGFEITGLTLASDVTAVIRFLPQVSGFWAMNGLSLGGPGGLGSSSGGSVDALLGLHEGSLALQVGTAARIEVGRFEMAYGEHVVIGNLDWHPNARAFDGARVHLTPDPHAYVDLFYTLVNEGHAISLTGAPSGGGFGQGDQSFYGAYAGLGQMLDAAPTTALDVYGLVLQTNNRTESVMGTATEREWSLRATIGARFRHRFDLLDVRAEGAFQTGRDGALRDAMTGQFGRAQIALAGFALGEVGVNLLEDHLRLALEGNFASGNNPTSTDVNEGYQQLFPTAHAFLGYSDVMGPRSNVASGVLHGSYRPIDQLAINLDWHVFVVPERPAMTTSNYAGQEGNLNVIWTPWAGFRARAMYGVFLPETAFFRTQGAPDYRTSPVHYLEVELAYVLR